MQNQRLLSNNGKNKLFSGLNSFLLISFVFFTGVLQSQTEQLLNKAEEFIYYNPDESIKIGEHLLSSSSNDSFKASFFNILSEAYYVKGNWNAAIQKAFYNGDHLITQNPITEVENNLLRAKLFRFLYLDKQSEECLYKAKLASELINSERKKDSLKVLFVFEEAAKYIERQEAQKAFDILVDLKKSNKTFLENSLLLAQKFDILKGRALKNIFELDFAETAFNSALSRLEAQNNLNFFDAGEILNELGYLYLQQKRYLEAEAAFLKALEFGEKLNNIPLLEKINLGLARTYLAVNDKEKHGEFNAKVLLISSELEQLEQEAINTSYSLLTAEYQYSFKKVKDKHSYYFYVTLALLFVVLLFAVVVFYKGISQKRKLSEIINYLEVSRKQLLSSTSKKKKVVKKLSIPDETEQLLIAKLKRFEKSTKYLNKEMSLALLAGNFETNTKYLSEVINRHYGDNFNTYINKLRINYIIDRLKNDPNYIHYKISFLAEKGGFSSHSTFATVFKTIVGMTPVTFINLLREEKEQNSDTN